MAKRKRLTPALPEFLNAGAGGLETKSALGPMAPIASVAGDASAAAALREVSDAMQEIREDGRLVQKIPLDQIQADHLRRDRMAIDDDEMAALITSIREHGQRMPIEVVELGEGAFGLISGWRRMAALESLFSETGETRFQNVLAFLRRPDTASDAYVAMVEENEIRVGLSYYERARIAALAVREGVYPTEKVALNQLFASASRAKRSKINAFLSVFHVLDEVLHFPTALGERQGLELAKALAEDASAGPRLVAALKAEKPDTAEAELALLKQKLIAKPVRTEIPEPQASKPEVKPQTKTEPSGPETRDVPREEMTTGVFLSNEGGYLKRRLVLEGPKVDEAFQSRLEAWLRGNPR